MSIDLDRKYAVVRSVCGNDCSGGRGISLFRYKFTRDVHDSEGRLRRVHAIFRYFEEWRSDPDHGAVANPALFFPSLAHVSGL